MPSETEHNARWISLDDDEGGETACWAHLVDEETGTVSGPDHTTRSIHPPAPIASLLPRDDASRPDAPQPGRPAASD